MKDKKTGQYIQKKALNQERLQTMLKSLKLSFGAARYDAAKIVFEINEKCRQTASYDKTKVPVASMLGDMEAPALE